jgi:hypothetical protein
MLKHWPISFVTFCCFFLLLLFFTISEYFSEQFLCDNNNNSNNNINEIIILIGIDYELDNAWIQAREKEAHHRYEKLDHELNLAKTNLNKDAIRVRF